MESSLPIAVFFLSLFRGRWVMEDLYRAGANERRRVLALGLKKLKRMFGNVERFVPGSGKTDIDELFSAERIPEPFRRILKVHDLAVRDYRPGSYAGRVTLFRARTRPLFRLHGSDLGWRALAQGGLEIVPIPGNHESILQEPNVVRLARALLDRLRLAQQAPCGESRSIP
jgi:hypothetical protein